MVLEAMCEPPFEPLQSLDLRMLSYKTALLMALASAKHVGDLSVQSLLHPVFAEWVKSGIASKRSFYTKSHVRGI